MALAPQKRPLCAGELLTLSRISPAAADELRDNQDSNYTRKYVVFFIILDSGVITVKHIRRHAFDAVLCDVRSAVMLSLSTRHVT